MKTSAKYAHFDRLGLGVWILVLAGVLAIGDSALAQRGGRGGGGGGFGRGGGANIGSAILQGLFGGGQGGQRHAAPFQSNTPGYGAPSLSSTPGGGGLNLSPGNTYTWGTPSYQSYGTPAYTTPSNWYGTQYTGSYTVNSIPTQAANPLPSSYGSTAGVPANPPPNPAPTLTASAQPEPQIVLPVEPQKNSVGLQARAATAADLQSAKAFLMTEYQKIASNLEQESGDLLPDATQLVSELNTKAINADKQIDILRAMKSGDGSQVQVLWYMLTKDAARAEALSKQVALQQAVGNLRDRLITGAVTVVDARNARLGFAKGSLSPDKQKRIDGLLDQLEERLQIQEALNTAVVGSGQSVSLAPGPASIIWNPGLPAHSAVSLGNGYTMIGAGGMGSLDLTNSGLAQVLGWPVGEGQPLQNWSGDEILTGAVLVNPPDTGTAVYYRINDRDFTLNPGQMHRLTGGSSWGVDFHRGGQFGRQTYAIGPGTYHFGPSNRGWDLFTQSFHLTIDNSENPQEFHYVLQNEPQTVPANQVRTHESKYPLFLRYDRGNGIKQVKLYGGTAKVALNGVDGLWDLYWPSSGLSGPVNPSF
jgi:hypothetical protein